MNGIVYWYLCIAIALAVGIPLGIVLHVIVCALFGWQFNEETGRWE